MLVIIIKVDIRLKLTVQISTIIYHHIKKILLKKINKYEKNRLKSIEKNLLKKGTSIIYTH